MREGCKNFGSSRVTKQQKGLTPLTWHFIRSHPLKGKHKKDNLEFEHLTVQKTNKWYLRWTKSLQTIILDLEIINPHRYADLSWLQKHQASATKFVFSNLDHTLHQFIRIIIPVSHVSFTEIHYFSRQLEWWDDVFQSYSPSNCSKVSKLH